MTALVANIAKGREVEFYNRVLTNDPTNSALKFVVIATGGADDIFGMQDYDTLATLLAANPEVTNTGYSRKTLTDASLSAWAPDDSANRIDLSLPLQTFTGIAAGSVWDILAVVYDNDTTGGTDANIVPVTLHELRVDGTAIPGTGDDILIDLSNGWITAT